MRRWLIYTAIAGAALTVVELVLLGVVIWWIGVPWTLALIVAKWVAGGLLARHEGLRGWRRFRAALDAGRPPGREVTTAAVGLGAALLILVAGFVSAVAGALVLVPPLRRFVAGLVERLVLPRLGPALVDDVFGPRRIRVRREGPTVPATGGGDKPAATGGSMGGGGVLDGGVLDGDVLEGDIVPPRP
jgi:UPF0716 protein FxsA